MREANALTRFQFKVRLMLSALSQRERARIDYANEGN